MKRHSRDLTKRLTGLGFDHLWINAHGHHCYVHPGDPDQTEILVNPSLNDEHTARQILRRAQKLVGDTPRVEKRNAQRIKDRASTDRERAQQRLDLARAHRQRLLDQAADLARIAEVTALVEQRERELAAYERLMRQPAQGGNTHRGTRQARHRAGAR